MYAALITLTIDPDQAPAAAAAFTQTILPAVKAAEGFVAGYSVDPVDSEGSVSCFRDSRAGASATPPASSWSAPGVTIRRTDVRRVAVAIP